MALELLGIVCLVMLVALFYIVVFIGGGTAIGGDDGGAIGIFLGLGASALTGWLAGKYLENW